MNKIQQLIQQYCPKGVEFKKIQDICKKITSGGTPLTSRSEYYNGNIPWLRTQEVDWIEITDTSIKITEGPIQALKFFVLINIFLPKSRFSFFPRLSKQSGKE